VFTDKNEKGRRRVSIFCYLEERGVVEHNTSGISCSPILERSRNRYHQRKSSAILMIKSGNTCAVVANPNCAVCRHRHPPRVNKVLIDMLCHTSDVRLEVCP